MNEKPAEMLRHFFRMVVEHVEQEVLRCFVGISSFHAFRLIRAEPQEVRRAQRAPGRLPLEKLIGAGLNETGTVALPT